MSNQVVTIRLESGLVKGYEQLAKRLSVPLATLFREALFLALIHIDNTKSGKVRFKEA